MTVPKGTPVIPLIHAIHMDPNLWKDPELFSPERFLCPDTGRVVKPEFFMPFGVGRRTCLGDVLARAELFLFVTSLLHVFTLRLPQGAKMPGLRGQVGVTNTPEKFQVKFTIIIPLLLLLLLLLLLSSLSESASLDTFFCFCLVYLCLRHQVCAVPRQIEVLSLETEAVIGG